MSSNSVDCSSSRKEPVYNFRKHHETIQESTSDFESGVNAIKQKKEDKKNKKTRVFGDPTGQYSDFFN